MSFRIDQLAVLNLATVGNSITAGSFVKSGGTSSQFLKADGSVDSSAYITGITSGMVTTALGYTPVPNTRNITINGVTQDLSVDRTWTISAGVSSVSGSGAGISVSPTTGAVVVSNTGVTSNVAGTGISVSGATGAVTITNTGVTSIVAGTAITISGATGAVTINNAGVTSVNGNTGAITGIITTSNYNSYSPTLTGGGASGTWGIDISGNSATTTNFRHLGTGVSYDNDRTTKVSGGLAVYSGYSTGANRPTTYDISAQFSVNGNMGMEIAADWISTSGPTLFARSLRDCCQNWSSWITLLTSLNYNSYSPTLTGGGASGTWSINITGSAGSASSASSVPWTGVTAGTRTNYDLRFQPPSNSYAGFEFNTSTGGGAGYFLVRGTSDNDVYTAEGITLVADAGWLTLAQRTTSDKGVRIMTGSTSTTRMAFNANGTTYLYTDLYLGSTNTRITASDAAGYLRIYGSSSNYLAIGPYANNGWVYFETSATSSGIYFNTAGRYAFDNVDITPYNDAENSLGNGSYRWAQVYTSGWLRQYGAQGMYNQDYGTHFYSNGGSSWGITGSGGNIELQFRSNHQSTIRGYVYADTGNNIGFLNNSGSWSLRTDSSRNTILYGQLTVGQDIGYSSIYMYDSDEGTREIHCNSNRIGFLTQAGSWGAWLYDGADWEAASSVRAPIFYDSDNTAYYANFADTGTSINIAGSLNAATYNKPGLLLNASGTSSSGAAFGMQQITSEGWSGIFVDYEPYTGWGLYHDNPANYFLITSESSTGSFGGGFTVPSRVSGNRTAYVKHRLDQNNGDFIAGGNIYMTGGTLVATQSWVNSQGFATGGPFVQNILGDSGAYNLNTSGQQAFFRFSTGGWVNGPTTGNYSHVLSVNGATDNRTVQIYLGDVPGYLWWRPNQGGTWHPWERILTSYNYNSWAPTLTGGGASGTWSINITGSAGSASTATYATNTSKLYSTDAGYCYGCANPYYGYLTYDGSRWLFQVSPGTPAAVRVAYSDLSGQVSINYNNDSNSTYQLLWGSGNSVYGTSSVYVNPYTDTIYAVSYRGSGNVGGTGEASNHPAGIYSQGTNWLYGTIYLNNNSIQDAANIYNSGWYRNYNQTGLYSQTYDNHFASYDTNYWRLASGYGLEVWSKGFGAVRGYLYTDGSSFGLLNSSGQWAVRTYGGSETQLMFNGSWRGIAQSSGFKVNGNLYTDVDYGYGHVGVYSSYRYQGVFAMGDSYKLPADGTSTGSLYGLAWSHPNAGGVAGNLNTHGLLVMENGTFLAAVSGSIRARDDMRAPIFYDSDNTGYYLNPAGTSNLYAISNYTRQGAFNMGRENTVRRDITSDQNYWGGAWGWGTGYGTWADAWKTGFSSWDIWGSGTDHPQGSGYVHAQGIISGQHYCTSDGSSAYGWMMVGAHAATENRYWLRGKWGGTTSGWVEMITSGNIGSQSVSYASSAGNTSSISSATGGSYTWTGINYFRSNLGGYCGGLSNPPLQVYSDSNNSAFFSFHKGGYYAVNMGLDADSVLRIGGWSAGSNRWQLDMSGNMTVAGDVTAYSDARVKENVETVEDALDKVLNLRGVYYNRTDSEDKRRKVGVIAQEILEVIPEVVGQDNDGMYNVSYGNIVGVLIEAIKEQQKQIDELKARLN